MQRRPESLSGTEFDLVIVGGGIYGACMAWEAVTRGLSVALLEQDDFGWATSANMHRILHGGFRYLRNADLKRIRESIRERNTMMRLAPHLTGPLPFLVPTTRSGIQNKTIMRLATKLYDALSFDRNKGINEPHRRIPSSRIVSREECLRLAPGLEPKGVTGGAVWYDGSLSDPARLTLQFVRSAMSEGAAAVNYVRATGFLRAGDRVRGVSARDMLSDETFEVRGRLVITCTGPWSGQVLATLGSSAVQHPTRYIRSVDVVTRPLTLENHGLAITAPQDGMPEQTIRYFIVPWRGLSVLGSVDYLTDTDPDNFEVKRADLEHLLRVLRATMPGTSVGWDDILAVQAGLIPHDGTAPMDDPYNAARHYKITDYGQRYGIEGLISVVGIKYTTARDIAERTVDEAIKRLGVSWAPSCSAHTPLYGGHIEQFDEYLNRAVNDRPAPHDLCFVETLVRTYGAAHGEVLALVKDNPESAHPVVHGSPVFIAQIVYAVRQEMAQKLSDIAVRRTNLAIERYPGRETLIAVAKLMGKLLGWNDARVSQELQETEGYLNRFWVRPVESLSGHIPS